MQHYIYRVLSMRGRDDKEYFFSSKYKATKFMMEKIRECVDEDGDWGVYDDKKVEKYLKERDWEKLGPFYSLWLSKVKLDNDKGILVYEY